MKIRAHGLNLLLCISVFLVANVRGRKTFFMRIHSSFMAIKCVILSNFSPKGG